MKICFCFQTRVARECFLSCRASGAASSPRSADCSTPFLLVQGAVQTLLCGAVQEYGYQHIRFVNCTNLTVSGPAVMYNSPSRLPFTQATIVNASADARNWTIQVVACARGG